MSRPASCKVRLGGTSLTTSRSAICRDVVVGAIAISPRISAAFLYLVSHCVQLELGPYLLGENLVERLPRGRAGRQYGRIKCWWGNAVFLGTVDKDLENRLFVNSELRQTVAVVDEFFLNTGDAYVELVDVAQRFHQQSVVSNGTKRKSAKCSPRRSADAVFPRNTFATSNGISETSV